MKSKAARTALKTACDSYIPGLEQALHEFDTQQKRVIVKFWDSKYGILCL